MPDITVDILASRAVCLGENVVCDGFVPDYDFRVQTHLHDDHMADFDQSKGLESQLRSQIKKNSHDAGYNG